MKAGEGEASLCTIVDTSATEEAEGTAAGTVVAGADCGGDAVVTGGGATVKAAEVDEEASMELLWRQGFARRRLVAEEREEF